MPSLALKDLLPAAAAGFSFGWFCAGSLPYSDPERAVRFVLDNSSLLPFWPELPNRSPAERMLDRARRAESGDWRGYREEEASALYALRALRLKAREKLPLIKGQLCGPWSYLRYTGKSVTDGGLDRAVGVSLKQMEFQRRALAGVAERVLLTLDEPGLKDWPSIPEAQRGELLEVYSYLYVRAVELDCFLGLHVCAPLDPGLLKLPFDLYSFDAVRYGIKPSPELSEAFSRGAVFAIGAFPACLPVGREEAALKEGQSRFEKIVEELGAGSNSSQILRAAACGHAASSERWVELLYAEPQ